MFALRFKKTLKAAGPKQFVKAQVCRHPLENEAATWAPKIPQNDAKCGYRAVASTPGVLFFNKS